MELASLLSAHATVSATPDEQALSDARRAITFEAMMLVQQAWAARKRREPLPYSRPLKFPTNQTGRSEAAQCFDITPMHTSPVNVTAKAAEPAANSAKPEAPASVAESRRNWAALLDQHRPDDRTVTPLAAIVARGKLSRPSAIRHGDAPAASVTQNQTTRPAKTWEQVQTRVFAEIPLPAGIHDGYVLSRLAESRRPISGLVVSIGINVGGLGKTQEQAGGTSHQDSIPAAVRTLIRSLLGAHDFACAAAPDEYLLIFPQDKGPAAQRRLKEIAQKLWDFQLRMLGQTAILFSWGGVEVRGESIDEAIASASDRMQETRRSRSAKTLEKHGLRVAG